MRPWMTIALILLIVAAIVYFRVTPTAIHPREGDFVNCYADLAMLAAATDSTTEHFAVARDSVLAVYRLTDSTLLQLKLELNRDPDRLIEIWDKIEAAVKQRRVALGQKVDDPKD